MAQSRWTVRSAARPAAGRRVALAALALGALGLTACGENEIVHGLQEREANQILVVLESKEIPAKKVIEEGRVITWKVLVPSSAAHEARRILVDAELPQPKSTRLEDVFQETGMIPTQSEEKAKMLIGIQGEIEKKVKLIPGVLDVHAQIVIPDKEAVRDVNQAKPLPMASVVIVYEPVDGKMPYRTEDVQKAVAASVEELTPDRVTVLSYRNQPFSRRLAKGATEAGECPPGAGVKTKKMLGVQLVGGQKNMTKFMVLLSVAGGLIVLLLLLTIFFLLSRIGLKRQLSKALAENLAFKKARGQGAPG